MDIEPERFRAAIGALGGAAIYGLVQFGTLAMNGHRVTADEYRGLAVNVACATLAGVILASFLVKTLAPLIPWPPMQEASAFGFGIGAFGWELLPLLFKVVKNEAAAKAEEITGGDK